MSSHCPCNGLRSYWELSGSCKGSVKKWLHATGAWVRWVEHFSCHCVKLHHCFGGLIARFKEFHPTLWSLSTAPPHVPSPLITTICQGRSSWSKVAPGGTHDHVDFSRCKSYSSCLERATKRRRFQSRWYGGGAQCTLRIGVNFWPATITLAVHVQPTSFPPW
jgi:hypothetical protein